jgi:hypothetical protein
MSVASVLGEITQLARDVPVDEEVTGRTEDACVVGDARLDHVLRAVAALRGEFGEDALVPREAQTRRDVAHAKPARSDEGLVLATEGRTRCAVREVGDAGAREAVVVQQGVPVVDAEPPAVRAASVAFVLLERALHALPATREVADGARLLPELTHTLEDRDCRRTHGRVALEHHARRVVGHSRGDVGRERPEPCLGVRGRVAAKVAYSRLHVRVIAPDRARQTRLLAEPVLVVPG